jgi:hypothetical protein
MLVHLYGANDLSDSWVGDMGFPNNHIFQFFTSRDLLKNLKIILSDSPMNQGIHYSTDKQCQGSNLRANT